MYSKTSLMALCAAVAVKEVAAGHGHQHKHADKREIVWAATDTVIVTDYVTVTVTEGEEPTIADVPTSIKGHVHHTHSIQTSAAVATSESSASESVADVSTSVVVPSTSVAIPTATPTTLVTAVKPSTTSVVQPTTTTIPTTSAVVVPTTSAVVVPTTSTSAAATTSVVASSGAKRGLAFNDASLVQEYVSLGGAASWAYNWGDSTANLPSGISYIPMLWSPATEHSNGWDTLAKEAIANGADALLGFNEPDIDTQANMSPADAASAHIQWMNPFSGQARISTPAISSSEDAGHGIDWLNQFFSACAGQCKFDFCAAHWYGPGGVAGADLFLSHLLDVQTACGSKPVWVTEFAAQSDDIELFMGRAVSQLETNSTFDFVEKYSYFMASVGSLFNTTTTLSGFGRTYAGLPQ
ncbi:glycosyl hydrolase catalytic core-domain-containing protein [Hypoxylon argillaceum]|nr:glycosyl hydrolase catalytic core-domain-containing protein [Hypoxylon argillaceum]